MTHTETYQIVGGWPHVFGQPLFAGDDRTLIEVVDQLAERETPHLVITPNVDQLLLAEKDPHIRDLFGQASLLLTDGAPLAGLSRALGAPTPPRHTGADLLPAVTDHARTSHKVVAITGGRAEVTTTAAQSLRERFPGAEVVAVPFPDAGDDDPQAQRRVIDELWRLRPNYVFVCLGFPKQENWVIAHQADLPPAVYVGAGAAVDFAAGTVKRAPEFVRRWGFEWLWRLGSEPRRLAYRYLVRGPGFLRVAARAWTLNRRPA